jgi:hypothetical protein
VSISQLNDVLTQLELLGQQDTYPFFAELSIPPRVLMISFGQVVSAVRYYDTNQAIDDYSLGEEGDGLVVIFYGGHWTEVERRELIPYAHAKRALQNFFVTGEKPRNITWQYDRQHEEQKGER